MSLLNPNLYAWIIIFCILSIGWILENYGQGKNISFPFITFTIMIFYHDFFFLNFSYYLEVENIAISSSWKEVFLLSLIFLFFLGGKIRKMEKNGLNIVLFCVFFVSLGLVTSVFFSGSNYIESVLIGKKYIFPFLFITALVIIPSRSIDTKKSCDIFFILVIIPNFLFGLWEFFNIEDLSGLWFHDPLLSSGKDISYFNHFRDGQVRANGFFIGTLAYGATAFCSCSMFFILRKEKYSILKLSISIIMLFLSQTRVFFIGLVFLIGIYILFKYVFKKGMSTRILVIVLLSAFFIILFLLPLVTNEASAMGRIIQWENAIKLLFDYPFGQGFSGLGATGDNRADSQIIDMIRIFGFFSLLLFIGIFRLVSRYWNQYSLETFNPAVAVPVVTLISYFYILFFQSLMDVAVFYFLLLILIKANYKDRIRYA